MNLYKIHSGLFLYFIGVLTVKLDKTVLKIDIYYLE